jgi:hypothetical protein
LSPPRDFIDTPFSVFLRGQREFIGLDGFDADAETYSNILKFSTINGILGFAVCYMSSKANLDGESTRNYGKHLKTIDFLMMSSIRWEL